MKIKIEPTDSRLEELQHFQFSYNFLMRREMALSVADDTILDNNRHHLPFEPWINDVLLALVPIFRDSGLLAILGLSRKIGNYSSEGLPITAQGLARNHAFSVEFWHVLVKQTSGIGFQWQRPHILSGYSTGNKEIEVDPSSLLGMCILNCGSNWPVFKTKGHPSNIHSKSQWMSMVNPVAVLKRLIPGLFWRVSQSTENAENAF
jgi:hypothetical protein